MSQFDKDTNKKISQIRIKVENAFAGMKRLKIVYDVFRNIIDGFDDMVFLIACGIWNLYLSWEYI